MDYKLILTQHKVQEDKAVNLFCAVSKYVFFYQ